MNKDYVSGLGPIERAQSLEGNVQRRGHLEGWGMREGEGGENAIEGIHIGSGRGGGSAAPS